MCEGGCIVSVGGGMGVVWLGGGGEGGGGWVGVVGWGDGGGVIVLL